MKYTNHYCSCGAKKQPSAVTVETPKQCLLVLVTNSGISLYVYTRDTAIWHVALQHYFSISNVPLTYESSATNSS